MRIRRFTGLAGGVCALWFGAQASATYNGLSIDLHTTVTIGGVSRNVFRVYANFTDPGDRLVIIFGSNTYGAMTLESRNANDSGTGSGFYNFGTANDNIKAPTQAAIDTTPALQWDTFVTIGTPVADYATPSDFTSLSPGFQGIGGTVWTQNNMGWYLVPTYDDDGNPNTPKVPPAQSVASWQGDGDAAIRVMLAQLTVNTGENVRGTINLSWFTAVAFGGTQTDESFQSFNSFAVPEPGAMVLLGVAGLMTRLRRRRR